MWNLSESSVKVNQARIIIVTWVCFLFQINIFHEDAFPWFLSKVQRLITKRNTKAQLLCHMQQMKHLQQKVFKCYCSWSHIVIIFFFQTHPKSVSEIIGNFKNAMKFFQVNVDCLALNQNFYRYLFMGGQK